MPQRGSVVSGSDDLHSKGKVDGRIGCRVAEPFVNSYMDSLTMVATSAAWLVCSTTIILVNRYLMIDLKFKFPIAVAAIGMSFR